MRHGLLWSFLIYLSLSFSMISAQEIAPNTRQSWLDSKEVKPKAVQVKQFAENGDVDSILMVMKTLPLYQQETIRFLLLEQIEQEKMLLTPSLARYIESLSELPPIYHIRSIGEGYEFTSPAFPYPSIAKRVLRRWNDDQKIHQFIISAERKELVLENWLNEASVHENNLREKLLIEEMDGLSPPAIEFFVDQVIQSENKIIFWLPSSEVMVRLAQESEDIRAYKLLWKMKVDMRSKLELYRLMQLGDDYSTQIIIDAASNPSFYQEVIKYLVIKKPLSEEIKTFLVSSLSMKSMERASFVASELSEQGYDNWLKQLLNSNESINRKAIEQVISE